MQEIYEIYRKPKRKIFDMEKLALEGGKPVREKPFPARIIFDDKEKKASLRVIEKTMKGPEAIDLYGNGEEVAKYKKEFAGFFGTKFATPTTSGTAAIHTALGSLSKSKIQVSKIQVSIDKFVFLIYNTN